MTTTYIKHEDPGHGWLQVPLSELEELGIRSAISPYSYRDSHFAYLEEDCDMKRFIIAKGSVCDIQYTQTNHDSFIRNLNSINY